MRAMTGVIKNRHGTYYAQQKVPKGLQEATAQVLGVARDRQVFLKKSLGTKDLREANIRAKPVVLILYKACGLKRVAALGQDG